MGRNDRHVVELQRKVVGGPFFLLDVNQAKILFVTDLVIQGFHSLLFALQCAGISFRRFIGQF